MRRPLIVAILKRVAVLLLVAATLAGWWLWQIHRSTITLENLLDVPLEDVRITVRGDEEAVGRIEPGGVRLVSISPASESWVTITYTAGGERHTWQDAYVEPNNGFRMDWTLEAGGVKWEQGNWPDW